jgi:hypothetical protein
MRLSFLYPRPEVQGFTDEGVQRTLEAVSWTPLFGADSVSRVWG